MSLDSLLDSLLAVPAVPQSANVREPLKGNQNKAGSPSSPGSPIKLSLLDKSIVMAIGDLPVTVAEIRQALHEDEIEGWNQCRVSTISLVNKAIITLARAEINQGSIPAYFKNGAFCEQCGPVWLWFEGNVSGCPWCANRINDLPIPRPQVVCCGDCKHFGRIDHPHLGHCAKGEPEAIAGNWDTDRRWCDYFIAPT
jgi:hypothetical protein